VHDDGATGSSTPVGGASASERIVTRGEHDDDAMGSATGWEHDDGAMGSSTAAVGGASTSEWISTGWEHDDSAMGSSTAAVSGASTSERISMGWEHDDVAVGCCFARRERWEGRFLVRVG
jgi:hypothetical protein